MTSAEAPDQSGLPDRWWEHASGVVRYSFKWDGLTLRDVLADLDDVERWGFDAIELFAPYHGGTEYYGLDPIDFYEVDPAIGTESDLRELLSAAHERGIAMIAFFNLGYAAEEFPPFLAACDDVREGRDSEVAGWFRWSQTGEETPKSPLAPHFMNDGDHHWEYSERAEGYYYVKWEGIEDDAALPQFDFSDPGWRAECERVVRHWMDYGFDGMIVDAVNWYLDCDWERNETHITGPIHDYPNSYSQPEGAGGFGDDPVPWIRRGGYTSVQDYAFNCWWSDHDVFGDAIENQDASVVEDALQEYRDRVVAAGGVTYIGPHWPADRSRPERLLEIATIATVGELFHEDGELFDLDWPESDLERARELVRTLRGTPALQAAGDRTRIETENPALYAFTRTSVTGEDHAFVALNYRADSIDASIDFDEPVSLRDCLTGERRGPVDILDLSLGPYEYRLYEME